MIYLFFHFCWQLRQYKRCGKLVHIESSIHSDFRTVTVKVLPLAVFDFGGWAERGLHQPFGSQCPSNDTKNLLVFIRCPPPRFQVSVVAPFPFPTEAPPC